MQHTDALVTRIEKMEEGSHIGAFFDFDGTLISGFSATVFLREQRREGLMTNRQYLDVMITAINFSMGLSSFSDLVGLIASILKGVSEADYRRFAKACYQKYIADLIYPESRLLVEAHLRKGHTVAIISSATPYQLESAATELGITHIMSSHLEVEAGVFTGKALSPSCFGQGKVIAAEALAKDHGVDLAKTWFYSDSHDDIELLERVGHPFALNPNKQLQDIAHRRNWPTRRFTSRGKPTRLQYIRTLMAYGAVATSFMGGLGLWGVSGSKQSGRNLASTLFGEVASALIGLKLKVNQQGNLWRSRPAVVIFNHQSLADGIIMMKLMQANVVSIGKQAIADIPLLGQAYKFNGLIPIDSGSTIEAMQPLVDALCQDQLSVMIAPEGRRSESTYPGPFKKEAFHLAMQAGVPIVPVVIHNSRDSQPKGEFAFRPATIEIDVLDPIDTLNWQVGDLDNNIAQVRNLFLECLGYPKDPLVKHKTKAK